MYIRRVTTRRRSSGEVRLFRHSPGREQKEAGGSGARVVVVVNSYGIDLLRADADPYRARIGQLAADRRLAFVACGQTLARLAREGERVVLLPEARVGTSAISEIVARLREGWGYVQV